MKFYACVEVAARCCTEIVQVMLAVSPWIVPVPPLTTAAAPFEEVSSSPGGKVTMN